MWITDLAQYISDQNIPNVMSNVYAFNMTSDEPGCMITTLTQGINSSPDIPNMYKGTMQVIVRTNNLQDSLNAMQAISDLLSSHQKRMAGEDIGLELADSTFLFIYPHHYPVVFPRSEGDFYEASVNFDVCFIEL